MAGQRLLSNEVSVAAQSGVAVLVLPARPGRKTVLFSAYWTTPGVAASISWHRKGMTSAIHGYAFSGTGFAPLLFRREDWGCMIDGELWAWTGASGSVPQFSALESFVVPGEDPYL